jgi:LuxR family maltose regulon positive regulatory protein
MDKISSGRQPILLLQTKLNRPVVATDLVNRPRLLNKLADAPNRRLILISAPAGFGKSTLLCQWLNDAPVQAAWLSLDEDDNDLLTFLNYLIAAIRTVFPHACSTSHSLLHAIDTPPTDYLATTLINELADVPADFMLVLDDYHHIQTPAIHQLLAKLLDHLPPALHLVLTSRADPPFSLSRLRSRGQLTEIRSADLRFSAVETTDFLTMTVGVKLPPAAATTLETRTEGWIAGLRLAAISLQNHPAPEEFLATLNRSMHRPVMEYLLDEVLDQQPVEVQDFLIKTSISDRFCLAMCQAIIAADEPEQTSENYLDWLIQTDLFLVRLDEVGEWYRYHHLFQELLQHRLRLRLSTSEINDLHCHAGHWLADQGYFDEALSHFLAADDLLAAAQLVEQNYQALINREESPVVRHWLERLPLTIIEQRPALLIARSWCLDQEFRLASINPLLEKAERLLEVPGLNLSAPERHRLYGEINAQRAQLLYFQGNNEAVLGCARQALVQLPATAVFARSAALLYLGAATQALGHKNEALQLLQAAIDAELGHNTLTMRMFLMIAFVHRLSANFKELHQTGQLFLRAAQETGLSLSLAWASHHLGMLFYEWNELDAAERHLVAVMQHRYQAHRIAFRDSLMGLALIYLARDDTGKLDQTLNELEAFTQQVGDPLFLRTYASFVARIRLRQGNLEAATRESQPVTIGGSLGPLPFVEHPTLTRVRILLGQDHQAGLPEAALLLDQLQTIAETSHNTLRLIEILALRALLCQATGQPAEAMAHLAKSLRLAQPGQLIRTFVDLGQPLANLLRQMADRHIEPDYVQRLLAAFGDGPQETAASLKPLLANPGKPPLIDSLTNREIEILELLQQRLSNKEIATTLFIAPATANRHISNIYRKLDVNSRRQAVARALMLGILSAP